MEKEQEIMQKALYWMLELKANWDERNDQETADYGQLLEDIEETEKLISVDFS